MDDTVEDVRRAIAVTVNRDPSERAELEAIHGKVWDTEELRREFEVISFGAPLVVVRRKDDRTVGVLMFQHHPRYYFNYMSA